MISESIRKTHVVPSLGEVVSPEFEANLAYAVQRKLVSGIAVGVLADGEFVMRIAGDGLTETSAFEIGSITKLFTTELIHMLVQRGVLRWDEPVSRYLPECSGNLTAQLPAAEQITLLDIVSHTAGLPLLPPNIRFVDSANPFGSYSRDDLRAYLAELSFQKPAAAKFEYSNAGFGIVGYVAEVVTGTPYRELLQREVLDRHGLSQTYLALIDEPLPAVTPGSTQSGRPAARWTQDALAPAGALCSTVRDQLCWIEVLLANAKGRDLDLGWGLQPAGGWRCRDGTTGGFSSYLGINYDKRSGVVILTNRKCTLLMQALGTNCVRGLDGLPLLGLSGSYGKLTANVLDPLRDLKRIPAVSNAWQWVARHTIRRHGNNGPTRG